MELEYIARQKLVAKRMAEQARKNGEVVKVRSVKKGFISIEMRQAAEELERLILPNLKDKPNYTKLVADKRYFTGFLGEQCVLNEFKIAGVRTHYEAKVTGESERQDFTLWMIDGYQKTADAKTKSYRDADRLEMPLNQFGLYHYDFYIAVRFVDHAFYQVEGYSRGLDLITDMHGFGKADIPVKMRLYTELDNFDDLLAKMAKGEVTEAYPWDHKHPIDNGVEV